MISTLTQAGFEAYIVGGGVRDALLGLKPKDFDAVTNATPNQIKEVFGKRCRIIGRRFQLCHVYSGRDMIEVATFRAPPKDNNHLTEDGMIMRDNVWVISIKMWCAAILVSMPCTISHLTTSFMIFVVG